MKRRSTVYTLINRALSSVSHAGAVIITPRQAHRQTRVSLRLFCGSKRSGTNILNLTKRRGGGCEGNFSICQLAPLAALILTSLAMPLFLRLIPIKVLRAYLSCLFENGLDMSRFCKMLNFQCVLWLGPEDLPSLIAF